MRPASEYAEHPPNTDGTESSRAMASMAKILALQGTPLEKQSMILSGAAYGSSFVGVVHVLRNEET